MSLRAVSASIERLRGTGSCSVGPSKDILRSPSSSMTLNACKSASTDWCASFESRSIDSNSWSCGFISASRRTFLRKLPQSFLPRSHIAAPFGSRTASAVKPRSTSRSPAFPIRYRYCGSSASGSDSSGCKNLVSDCLAIADAKKY